MGFFEEARETIRNSNRAVGAWGRAVFANNFAEGGLASYMFGDDTIKVERGLLTNNAPGSRRYMQNLQALVDRGGPEATAAEKLIAKNSGRFGLKSRIKGGLIGGALMMGIVAYQAATTQGPTSEKVKAGVGGLASFAGGAVGWKAGMAMGAAIGSYTIPVVGTAVGALAGAVVGSFAGSALGQTIGEATFGALDSIAARGRKRRTSNWIGDMSAFRTQKAATMRQASLQMMNNGMMTARSALGNEGVMFHQ